MPKRHIYTLVIEEDDDFVKPYETCFRADDIEEYLQRGFDYDRIAGRAVIKVVSLDEWEVE